MRRNTKVVPIFRSRVGLAGVPYTSSTGVPMSGNVNENGALWVVLEASIPGGGGVGQAVVGPDNADNQPVQAGNSDLLTQARLFGYDEIGDNWDRIRSVNTVTDSYAPGGIGNLSAAAFGLLFNNATYDRARSASAANLAAFLSLGAGLVSLPGDWGAVSTPAVSAQASATRVAGAAGVRHVCTSISFSLGAVAAEGSLLVNLRDGTTGVGTILWSMRIGPFLAGTSGRETISGLNIVGSAATAMTLEFAAAPTATNFETVSLTGHDAS